MTPWRAVSTLALALALAAGGGPAFAADPGQALSDQRVLPSDPTAPPGAVQGVPSPSAEPPPDLRRLIDRQGGTPTPAGIPEQRLEGMKMAATSYGIRGGLAHRTWEINRELERQAGRLSGIYNFAALVIPLPEGGSVIPPVVEDGDQAMSVSGDGTDMKASKKVLRIIRPAHISPILPNWRVYLVRYWPVPDPPRDELMPQSDDEKGAWSQWVANGWEIGVRQANDIFRVDVDRLTRDMVGMALYHRLVAQGMIHDLYIDQHDRGVTGGGDTLHIGERLVRITAPAQLNPKTGEWSPIILDQP